MYTQNILSYSQNPPNYGAIKDADIILESENPSCGDNLKIFIKLDNEKIINARFVGEGCAISKASASMTLEDIVGSNIKDIKNISYQDVIDTLGIEVSSARKKCANLIIDAFSSLPAPH